jgi:hypothetical protein
MHRAGAGRTDTSLIGEWQWGSRGSATLSL